MRGPHHDRHRPPAGHDRARRPRRAARRRPRRRRRHPRGAPRRRAPSTARCSRPPRPEHERRPTTPDQRRGGGATDLMWMQGGVDEEDRLDAEAAKHVLRRAGQMLRPVPAPGASSPSAWSSLWTGHDPRRPVPRPLRHRPRHQGATTPARSNAAVVGYVVVAVRLLRRLPLPGAADQPHRRVVPPRPARPGVRPPAAPVDAVLRPREGRRDRVPHDVRRRLAAGARADGPAHVREQRAAARRVRGRARRRVVEAPAALPRSACRSSCWRASSSSATRTRPTSTSATASATRSRSCRRASPACASSRPSAARTSRPSRFERRQPAAVRRPHALGEDLGLVPARSSSSPGLLTTAIAVGVGGCWVHTGELTVGTVTFFVLTLSNLFEPIQQLCQLFNIVQSAGAALNKLFGLLDTPVDVPERPGAVDLPERGDIEVDGRRVRLRRRPAGARATSTCTSPSARGSRSSGPPAPASPRWPSSIARLYDPTEGAVRYAGIDLRDATLRSLRERIVVVPAGGLPVQRHDPRERAPRPRRAPPTPRCSAALDAIGVRERFAAAPRGARHRGARARLAPVGGGEAARVAGPGRAGRPRGARARRGHLQPRPRHRGGRRAGDDPPDGGPHRDRDRPPPLHRRAGRPRRRGGRGPPPRARHPRRAASPRAAATPPSSPPGQAAWPPPADRPGASTPLRGRAPPSPDRSGWGGMGAWAQPGTGRRASSAADGGRCCCWSCSSAWPAARSSRRSPAPGAPPRAYERFRQETLASDMDVALAEDLRTRAASRRRPTPCGRCRRSRPLGRNDYPFIVPAGQRLLPLPRLPRRGRAWTRHAWVRDIDRPRILEGRLPDADQSRPASRSSRPTPTSRGCRSATGPSSSRSRRSRWSPCSPPATPGRPPAHASRSSSPAIFDAPTFLSESSGDFVAARVPDARVPGGATATRWPPTSGGFSLRLHDGRRRCRRGDRERCGRCSRRTSLEITPAAEVDRQDRVEHRRHRHRAGAVRARRGARRRRRHRPGHHRATSPSRIRATDGWRPWG